MRRGKVCLGVFFIIGAMIYIIIAVMEAAVRVPMAVLAALFLLFAFLLLRKKKEKPMDAIPEPSVSVSFASREVPEEILKQMRKSYTRTDAMRDAQIMRESFIICQQTIDFDVFCMRYELSYKKAYTLLQAEQAKCRGVAKLKTRKAAESVLGALDALRIDFLDRAVTEHIYNAMNLKTPRGQKNRLQKLRNELQAKEYVFSPLEDEYNTALDRVNEQLAEIEKVGED